MIAPCRLYLTVDGQVVFGDDDRAAFLLCGVGAEIPRGHVLPTVSEKVEAVPTAKAERGPRPKKTV